MVLKVSIPYFHSMPSYYRHFLAILHHFLHCLCDLPMEYFEYHSFTVSIMEVIASLIFLIFPWFPQYFLYLLNATLSLLGSLYLSTKFSWFLQPSFKNFTFFVLSPKMQKSCYLRQLRKKIQ